MADTRKTIVILGITGNQGSSVAHTFLTDPHLRSTYKIRGLSRDPSSSPTAQALLSQGVEEIVKADLHDPSTLTPAFAGASVIFSVTDFWHPFHNPTNQARAAEAGKSIGQYAYELEYEQGRHIADAAAAVEEGLERFIVSSLNSPRKWSRGKYEKLWHYESKSDMVTYVQEKHKELAGKMSRLNMGVFYTSWKFALLTAPRKVEGEEVGEEEGGGWHRMELPCNGDKPIPLVDARKDTGPFVRALLQVPPGVNLLGETSLVSWKEYMRIWGQLLGVRKSEYREVSIQSYDEAIPGGFGKELAEMFHYMGEFGYDGGDPDSVRKEEVFSNLSLSLLRPRTDCLRSWELKSPT